MDPSDPIAKEGHPPLISLRGISKVFLTDEIETHALSDITLQIKQRDFAAIVGPSGCGKSTLLSILGLMDRPTSGEYELDRQPLHALGRRERVLARSRLIGFIFQSFNLIGDLTVYQNIELPLLYQGRSETERRSRTLEVLGQVDMKNRANHYPHQLSGGQQQRVAVARALSVSPKVLLADEPTGNLDSKNGQRVMELLRDLSEAGCTICMVTHDERHTAFANRIVRMLDGKLDLETR
jgi:putative ABC transport system ATP-binding protein